MTKEKRKKKIKGRSQEKPCRGDGMKVVIVHDFDTAAFIHMFRQEKIMQGMCEFWLDALILYEREREREREREGERERESTTASFFRTRPNRHRHKIRNSSWDTKRFTLTFYEQKKKKCFSQLERQDMINIDLDMQSEYTYRKWR